MASTFSWDRTLPIEPEQPIEQNAEPFSWENTRSVGQREQTHPLDVKRQMSREDYLALPFEERAAISKELGATGQQEVGEDFLTGALPGLNQVTEYAREKGFLPEKVGNEYAAMAPHMVGRLAPLTAAFKGVEGLTSFLKLNPAIAPYINAALGAAGFEAVRKPLEESKFASPGELGTEALIGSAAVGAGKLIGKGIEKGKQLFGKQPQAITQGLEEISQTPFETAEETLNILKAKEKPIVQPQKKTIVQEVLEKPKEGTAPSLTGRVTKQKANRIGIEIPTTEAPKTFEESVLKGFPYEVENSTRAGKKLADKVQEVDEQVYKKVNDLYAKSRDANKEVIGGHPDLVDEMQTIVDNINKIPDPSPIQKKLRQSSNKLIKRLAKKNEKGEIVEYTDISNQDLIDQMQAWRQLIDYDFAHGDPHNIFKPAIKAVETAVNEAAEIVGGEAAEFTKAAKKAYREWTEVFNEGDIKKFRRGGNLNYSQNFKNSVNIDDINKLRPILEASEEGKALLAGMQRELAEKELSKFMVDPRSVNKREFEKKLRELSEVLAPEQIEHIRTSFEEGLHKFGRKATQKKGVPTLEGKYEKAIPEDVLKKMDSRSGIREVRQDLKGNPEQFDKHAKQKVKSILLEGNVEGIPTGDELYMILNKTSNREILSELLGNEAYGSALAAARQIGKNKATRDAMSNIIRKGSIITKVGAVGLLL